MRPTKAPFLATLVVSYFGVEDFVNVKRRWTERGVVLHYANLTESMVVQYAQLMEDFEDAYVKTRRGYFSQRDRDLAAGETSPPTDLPVFQVGGKKLCQVWPELAECWEFDWASRSDDN